MFQFGDWESLGGLRWIKDDLLHNLVSSFQLPVSEASLPVCTTPSRFKDRNPFVVKEAVFLQNIWIRAVTLGWTHTHSSQSVSNFNLDSWTLGRVEGVKMYLFLSNNGSTVASMLACARVARDGLAGYPYWTPSINSWDRLRNSISHISYLLPCPLGFIGSAKIHEVTYLASQNCFIPLHKTCI